MNAVEIIRQQARMCATYPLCADCPIDSSGVAACISYREKNPEKVVKLVEKWAKEHPEKTILQDFLEKYQNATLSENGTPLVCARYLGYCNQCPTDEHGCPKPCRECWNHPLEDSNV